MVYFLYFTRVFRSKLQHYIQTQVLQDGFRQLKRFLGIKPPNGYPPDKQEKATITVLDQANLLCKDWAETPC